MEQPSLPEQSLQYAVGKAYAVHGYSDWIVRLAICLLEEQMFEAKSKWRAYLQSLPGDADLEATFPVFYSDKLLAKLSGSRSLVLLEQRRKTYQDHYEKVKRAYPEWPVSQDQFFKALLLVNSRNFGIMVDGKESNAMVPFVDLLNHTRPPSETEWTFNKTEDAFTLTTTSFIPSGSSVYDSYGKRCNTRLFVGYGFTLKDNPENMATVDEVDLMLGWDNPVTQSFMRTMLGKYSSRIDVGQKTHAVQRIRERVQKALAAFETTLDQDEATLQMHESLLPLNERKILGMIMGEKRILHWFLQETSGINSQSSLKAFLERFQ